MKINLNEYTLGLSWPKVSKKRTITTTSLATGFSTLWIAAPSAVEQLPLVPDAMTSAQHVLVGLAIPYGIGYVTLLLAEWRIMRELRAKAEQAAAEAAERAEVERRAREVAEAEQHRVIDAVFLRHANGGYRPSPRPRTIEGEVVSR